MASDSLSMDERTGLIASILSNPDEVEAAERLSRGDAQAFVDTICGVRSLTIPRLKTKDKAIDFFRSGVG